MTHNWLIRKKNPKTFISKTLKYFPKVTIPGFTYHNTWYGILAEVPGVARGTLKYSILKKEIELLSLFYTQGFP